MSPYRHKKLERGSEPPANFRIQTRDLDILRDVAEYRFLSTEQILALYPTSPRNVRERLLKLYELGYLERPRAQESFPRQKKFLIYSLGDKGAEELSRKKFGRGNTEVSSPYLAHWLMIAQFRATLTIALRKSEKKMKIERWIPSYDLSSLLSSRGQSSKLLPDAFFTIEKDGKTADFFLEADQGTMPDKSMLEKMKTYWKWRNDTERKKKLNLEHFRVLTVTKGGQRAENLRRITKQADDARTGSGLFLFLSETQYSLESPETILSHIWLSPKDDTLHSIIE